MIDEATMKKLEEREAKILAALDDSAEGSSEHQRLMEDWRCLQQMRQEMTLNDIKITKESARSKSEEEKIEAESAKLKAEAEAKSAEAEKSKAEAEAKKAEAEAQRLKSEVEAEKLKAETDKFKSESRQAKIQPWLQLGGALLGAVASAFAVSFTTERNAQLTEASIEYEKTGIYVAPTTRKIVDGTISGMIRGGKK